MTFLELLKQIQATYPEQPRAFHVMATRFYLGSESIESLQQLIGGVLTEEQVETIIRNR